MWCGQPESLMNWQNELAEREKLLMPMGDAKRRGEDEQRRIEDRAASDAREWAKRIWRDGLPGGKLEPVAVQATYAYVEWMRQQSAAIPRWAMKSQDGMRDFIQWTGDRYYAAFLHMLGVTIGRAIPLFRAIPRTTPLPTQFPDMVTPLPMDDMSHDTHNPDWSGTHPTQQEGA